MKTTISSTRVRQVGRSMSWATVDQVFSALSNLVITLAVARGTGVDGLGRFAFAFAAYLAVLGFSRSLISEPMLAQRRADHPEAERAAMTLTVAFSLLGALVVAVAGVVLRRPELWVVALVLPVTLVQDVLRYLAFRRKKAQLAALLDGGWLLGSLAAWPVVTHSSSPLIALLCWAAAAGLGGLLAWPVVRASFAAPRTAVTWWRTEARALAAPLLIDSLLVTISAQALVFLLTYLGNDSTLGLLRAGQVYFAPLTMMFTALGVFAVPHLAQRRSTTTTRTAILISLATAALAALVCGVFILAEPLLHSLLYSDVIDVPRTLLVAIAAQVVVAAAGTGLVIVSKARGRGGDIARSRLTSTVAGLGLLVAGTTAFGLLGAAWALVTQAALYTAELAYRVLRQTEPISSAVPARTGGGDT